MPKCEWLAILMKTVWRTDARVIGGVRLQFHKVCAEVNWEFLAFVIPKRVRKIIKNKISQKIVVFCMVTERIKISNIFVFWIVPVCVIAYRYFLFSISLKQSNHARSTTPIWSAARMHLVPIHHESMFGDLGNGETHRFLRLSQMGRFPRSTALLE